jgi:hypothetical protein
MLKKIGLGVLGLGVLTGVLACDCQKVDNQASELGRTQQVIFIINHFDSKLDKSEKVKTAEAFGKLMGNQARSVVKKDDDNKMFSTSLNQDLRLENKNDLLK